MKSSRVAIVFWLGCFVGVTVEACSSTDPPSPAAPISEAGPAAASVSFTVPASGGSVDVPTSAGTTLNFAFPPSASGKTLVLTPTDPTSIGWTASDLRDVIRMEPDGTQFADPVIVRSSTGGVMLATFPTKPEKTAPEWLALSPDGKGAELHHFSTLAVVVGGCSFTEHTSAPACAQFFAGGGTQLDLSCTLAQFCTTVGVSCCVDPNGGERACQFGARGLKFVKAPAAGPAYCPAVDAGPDDATTDSTVATDAATDSTVTTDAASDAVAAVDAGADDAASDAGAAADATDEAAADGGSGDASPADSATDAGTADAAVDATVDSGVNGTCGSPMITQGNFGAGGCGTYRTDGTATLYMICSASTGCQCYVNDTAHPYGAAFDVGNTPCANAQLAMQQMMAYCGCP